MKKSTFSPDRVAGYNLIKFQYQPEKKPAKGKNWFRLLAAFFL